MEEYTNWGLNITPTKENTQELDWRMKRNWKFKMTKSRMLINLVNGVSFRMGNYEKNEGGKKINWKDEFKFLEQKYN